MKKIIFILIICFGIFLTKEVKASYIDETLEPHHIVPITSIGVTLNVPENAYYNDVVTLNYETNFDYQIVSIKIYTPRKEEVPLVNDTFIMPDEDVYIEIQAERTYHNIYVTHAEGISYYMVAEGLKNEMIPINYTVNENYVLEYIKVYNIYGQEIPFQNDSFEMPESDVIVEIKTHKKEGPLSHYIYVSSDDGVTVDAPKQGVKNEEISFSYHLSDEYEIDTIQIYQVNGEELTVTNNSFMMKDEDVVIEIKTHKKETSSSHKIFVVEQVGISLEVKEEGVGQEEISFSYQLEDHYELLGVQVLDINKKEIEVQNNRFVMPDCEVIIEAKIVKKEEPKSHYIYVSSDDGVTVDAPKQSIENKEISFSYHLSDDYEIDKIQIYQVNGEELTMTNNSFMMKDEDVVIEIKTHKKETSYSHKIFVVEQVGISLEVKEEGVWQEEISFSYQLEDHYELLGVQVLDNNKKEIEVQNNRFVMPNHNVLIIPTVQKKELLTPVIEETSKNQEQTFIVPNTYKTEKNSLLFLISIFYILLRKKRYS